MTIDTSIPRTRRALLAGGLGGAAALVATALGRPLSASANDPNDVVLGATNTATTPTIIENLANDSKVLDCFSLGGDAIQAWTHGAGKSAVHAWSETGDGIAGFGAGSGKSGVYGRSDHVSGYGVFGRNQASGNTGFLGGPTVGVRGTCPSGHGVYGTSSSGIGVRGGSTSSFGVHGTSSTSDGVNGFSSSGNGVYGRSPVGTGVRGIATSGIAIYGQATTGYALRTSGRLRVEKASGIATIVSGKTSVAVTPGLDVTSSSFVLLTPKADLGPRRLWYTTNTTANTITIRVSSAVTTALKVGWLLLG